MPEEQQKTEQQQAEAVVQEAPATEVAEEPAAEDTAPVPTDEAPADVEDAPEAADEAEAADVTQDQPDAEGAEEAPEAETAPEAQESPQAEAAAPEASEDDASDEDEGGDGEPVSEEPVNRMIEEAVAAASQEIGFPSTEEADVRVDAKPEPESAMSAAELDRSTETVGFTGEIQGRVVTLDELDDVDDEREDPIYDQFRQLVEQTSSDVREQEIVSGRVLALSGDDVVIDIGYKSDGIVDVGEFGDRELKPGDTVEVYLEYKEDWNGQLVLSKTKADQVRRWQRVEEAFENEEIIEGTIIRRIKGGMIAELFDGLEAFLPGSQIDVRPVRDFDAYLEKRMEFKIVKLNPSNENIVISHRALIQEELEEQRKKILSQLEQGQVLNGVVKNIVDFGVFVDLGGVDGLLHITDLSWGRVSHPSEVVDLDEELQVVVLDYEEERQRISLGLKQLQPHPWEDIGDKFDQDEVVEGKVVSITNYGAFVELEKGIEGLVHISEMSWTRHIKHPSQMVSLGQLVDVQILNIDEEERKISLGMKQLEPDPWTGISDRYPPGTVLRGTIRNITHFGVFVEIEPGIDGLVHISDLSWTKKIRHPKEVATKGDEMDVVILNIDEERRRISLGHKQVQTNPWSQFAKAYAEGADTAAEIKRVEEKGLVVELPLGVEAFVPGSELKQGPRNFQDYYQDGQELELRVIRFDQNRKDIVLSETAKDRAETQSERQAERQAERRERQEQDRAVRDYQGQQKQATGPTTIGEFSDLQALKEQMQADEAAAVEAPVEEAPAEEPSPDEPSTEEPSDEAPEASEDEAPADDAEESVDEADTTGQGRTAEEIDDFVEATGDEAVTTEEVKDSDDGDSDDGDSDDGDSDDDDSDDDDSDDGDSDDGDSDEKEQAG